MPPDDVFADRGGFATFTAEAETKIQTQESWTYLVVKRLVDILAALAGLILLAPLLPFILVLIKLETDGPILFKQLRVGQHGRLFHCYKFRSMEVGAEERKEELEHLNEATGAAFKIKHDPRITGVGRFLRQSSLDEFPQLLNVLKGEMSIVGPRPQIPEEVRQYTPQQALRLLVKPGLTCLWQISGRSHLDFEEWMKLDLEYVQQHSLRFDFMILCSTLPAVIERKGAY
jgi:lipopolysaccharide/colanic/teichoic acid biosynthesis glycosyltransferase